MAPRHLRALFVQGGGYRAGAERALLARLHRLPEHGIEPLVVFLADGPFRQEVASKGFETLLLGPAPHLRDARRLPAAIRELTRAVRARDADLVEGCGEKMCFISGWAARLAGRGCVYNLQDAPWRDAYATAVQLGAALGRHDRIVVPSQWMAKALRGPVFSSPVVIPNAVVLEDLPPEPADVRGLAGWPEESFVVGLVGRLVAWKGAEVLLRAASRLKSGNVDIRFLVVGGTLYGREPQFRRRLEDLTDALGVRNRVHFTGHRDDALALMSGCDAICHCSLESEPFGVVVVEGMALGKPVVATRTGGPEEIVEHGRTGILVDPGDVRGLAAQIADLAGHPRRRTALGDAARAMARRRFSSEAIAEPLASIYREVASRRGRPGRG